MRYETITRMLIFKGVLCTGVRNFSSSVNPGPFAHRDKSGRQGKRIQNRPANTALLVLRRHVYPCVRIPANIYAFPAFAYDYINHGTVTFPLRRMHKASGHAPVFTFIDFGNAYVPPEDDTCLRYASFTFHPRIP